MWRYSRQPARPVRDARRWPGGPDEDEPDRDRAGGDDPGASGAAGRTLLTEAESKQLLAAYGIPTVATRVAASEDEAVAAAEAIGYPVVLKLHSETITHKTDVGGVQLNLRDDDGGAPGVPRDRGVGGASGPAPEHFQGVTVQPMVKLRRLRADRRQQHRPAVRPGAAVRRGRAAGRGVQGPRAGACRR